MKKTIRNIIYVLAGAMLLPAAGSATNVDVCSQGTGVPPFLSSGAKPNLLMVLDNSGSMLDSAHSKANAFCFDDTYASGTVYAGYFDTNQWYLWIGPDASGYTAGSTKPYPPWKANTAYSAGDRVYVNGIIWKAITSGTSTAGAATLAQDIGVAWKQVLSIPQWKNGTAYAIGDIVWSGPLLYMATKAGTSNDPSTANGLNLADDTGVTWKQVESTWKNGVSYKIGDIVTYKGILYEATKNGTSNGTGVYDDANVTWKRLDEGSFLPVAQSAALSVCSGASGASTDKYALTNELCVSLDHTVTPGKTSAFAARGNFLNWAMASKFDVEKKILTGGKYNYRDQYMIGEHRGCSGSKSIKQVLLTGGKYLSLSVRGSDSSDAPAYRDRIDSTDDTARLEVLAVTATGYTMSEACKAAITKIVEKGLNGAQNEIDNCIASWPNSNSIAANTRPTLNNSLQACWQDDPATAQFEITKGRFDGLLADCVTLYTGVKQAGCNFTPARAYQPYELRPVDGSPYLCYGMYDSGVDAPNRVGYMGRVWIPGGCTGNVMKYCNPRKAAAECSSPYPCCWQKQGQGTAADSSCTNYRNTNSAANNGYVEQCTATSGSGSNAVCTQWKTVGDWSDDTGTCNYGTDTAVCINPTQGLWENSTWPNDPDVPAWPDNGITKAISDYCASLRVSEAIDPSTNAGSSGGITANTGNVPALLRDSELIAFLGGKDPLSTMKARIQQPTRPKGVLQNVASNLRLGAMSFNYVGAKTECGVASTNAMLQKYCPLNNADGAVLVSPLNNGDLVTAQVDNTYSSGKRLYVDDLAESINTIRGTDWTPLAEAMYEAVGYYTQNINFCLNKDPNDSSKCLDFPVDSDPVQFWCQNNNILLITEGESSMDVNSSVQTFANASPLSDAHLLSPAANCGTCACISDVLTGGGTNPSTSSALTPCGTSDLLYKSPYLDDMSWWGQHVQPLYKNRCVTDFDGNKTEKKNIATYVVATGSLTSTGSSDECSPEVLMKHAAEKGGTNTYYPGNDPQQLQNNLYAVLSDILSRSSAGSAASVISSSRSGSGAVYQAVFWPQFEDHADKLNVTPPLKSSKVNWVGDVHSLFLSSDGLMYEDSDYNGSLSPCTNNAFNGSCDRRILYYFSKKANRTRGCYNIDQLRATGQCPNEPVPTQADPDPKCPSTNNDNGCVELQDIRYLWSATRRLAEMYQLPQMNSGSSTENSTGRKIFTWNDANNDGIVDAAEWFTLDSSMRDGSKWDALNDIAAKTVGTAAERGPVTQDFLTSGDWGNFVTNDSSKTDASGKTDAQERDALNALIGWLQGTDQLNEENSIDASTGKIIDRNSNGRLDKELRHRYFKGLDPSDANADTWRLGDIIHSTPMVVAKPAESYHYIYRDPTYSRFANKWAKRRSVVYFGGNDGMMHAVNGGFYSEITNQFCCTSSFKADGTCSVPPTQVQATVNGVSAVVGNTCSTGLHFGQEMWAYVPYNLQPHLKCLAQKSYDHKYFVDQRPRIFDAQIFAEETACGNGSTLSDPGCVHPGGWGTILVGSMGFGGAPILASSQNGNANDKRKFISSFFVLDITNPEADPVLLGELTKTEEMNGTAKKYADLNYTTSSPSMVIMRDGTSYAETKWYLVLGNGPTELDGTNASGEQGKVAILPLHWLTGGNTVRSTVAADGVTITISPTGTNQIGASSGNPNLAFRVDNLKPSPSKLPASRKDGGIFLVPGSSASFISDIISVDYNIDLSSTDGLGARYRTDAVYFGTVDGASFTQYPSSYLNGAPDQFYWNAVDNGSGKSGGRIFRLVTKKLNTSTMSNASIDSEQASVPSDWPKMWDDNTPLRMLADVKMPVVAAPSVSYDGSNYWIYAGTGRFYSEQDKTDNGWCLDSSDTACANRSKISFFGFKEPIKDSRSVGNVDAFTAAGWSMSALPSSSDIASIDCYRAQPFMTWDTIKWDVNAKKNAELKPDQAPGRRGLLETDNIVVEKGTGNLSCSCSTYISPFIPNSSTRCNTLQASDCFGGQVDLPVVTPSQFEPALPNPAVSGPIYQYDAKGNPVTPVFENMRRYIAGTGCRQRTSDSKWISTGLDGWYRSFHEPRERNLGAAALLGGLLAYTTYQPYNDKCKGEGTSFLYAVHFQTGTAWPDFTMDRMNLGQGLATTVSVHAGTEKSDGGIVLRPSDCPSNGGTCGDGKCCGSETAQSCSADCFCPSNGGTCGDGKCCGSETAQSCPADCATPGPQNVGDGVSAFIQTSTGEIVTPPPMPTAEPTRSGRLNWTNRCYQQ